MKCLDEEDFDIYLNGGSEWKIKYINFHIEICFSCAEKIKNLQKVSLE